ncbi:MAG: hypothetical protein GXO74_07735 [Calditrichaeota bacterium]|nr:hypothetical protein [Calditrichota bacterium]
MVNYDTIFVPLSAALGLSITLERILEIAKNIMHRLIGNQRGKRIPSDDDFARDLAELENSYRREKRTREIEKLIKEQKKERKKILEQLKKERETKHPDVKKIQSWKKQLQELDTDVECDEEFPQDTVLVEPATDQGDGKTMKRFLLQMFGFTAGIIGAHYSGIQLFNSFLQALGQPAMPANLDYLLTGLLIGGGSGPMHVLVEFISQRKIVLLKEKKTEGEGAADTGDKEAPTVKVTPSVGDEKLWADVVYKGGVDRDLLEYVHRREKDPDLIVFHHTAMPMDASFEDIVRFIKDKRDSQGNRWLTGYHCVVMPDGAINAFCRWDRYGNHTAGVNLTSLGIALHGNFEIDHRVPHSNADGSFGDQRPTEIQLKNAARVVALWHYLYKIPLDFSRSILPHRYFSDKACPGSNFPYPEFQKWVDFFSERWQKSAFIQEKLAEFKLRPYVYAEHGGEAKS